MMNDNVLFIQQSGGSKHKMPSSTCGQPDERSIYCLRQHIVLELDSWVHAPDYKKIIKLKRSAE